MMQSLETQSVAETDALGERIGALLEPGDVVLLQGQLGAGKTALTKGIGRGAGSGDLVISPTFVLMNEYRGRLTLYHVDLYRLDEPDEIVALDLPGYTVEGALIVEWPERGQGLLPIEHLLVEIEYTGETERVIRLSANGNRHTQLLAEISRTAALTAPRA